MAEPVPAAGVPEPEPLPEPVAFPEPVAEPEPLAFGSDAAEEIPIGIDEPAEELPLDFEEPAEESPEEIEVGEDDDDVMSGLGDAPGPATDDEFSLDLPGSEAPAPLAAQPAQLQAAATQAPAATASGAPADLQKALADVEQYMSLGFVDDAKEALRQIQARHPEHPAIQQKVAELGLEDSSEVGALDGLGLDEPPPLAIGGESEPSLLDDLGEAPSAPAAPVVAEPPPPAEGEGMIDLGAELGDILGAQSAVEEESEEVSGELGDLGLTEIFNEFRKGVDKQLGQEDYDTRYNLGIAYKEMGLVDEAISEFQLAAKDPGRLFECSSMLGICFIEKGMPKIAVNWFQKALEAPGRNPEEYAGLRYDLASAYEAAGEVEEAVSLLTDLYAENSGFRDVATRLRELKAASR
jgi:tetratricopeptide (TPR) repeat protein